MRIAGVARWVEGGNWNPHIWLSLTAGNKIISFRAIKAIERTPRLLSATWPMFKVRV